MSFFIVKVSQSVRLNFFLYYWVGNQSYGPHSLGASSRSIRVRVCSQSPFAWANHNWESSSQGSCVAHGPRTCLSIKGHCQSTHVHINMSDARGASLRSPSALDHVERRLCARRRRWRLALRTALTFLLLFACQWYIHLDVGFLTDHEIDMIRRP